MTVLYQEACRGVAVFIEWRHKVMLLSTATLALIGAAASWAFSQDDPELIMLVPLTLGIAVSVQCRRFDLRTEELIQMCYAAAEAYEICLGAHPDRTQAAITPDDEPAEPSAHHQPALLPTGVWTRIHHDRERKNAKSRYLARRFGTMVPQSYAVLGFAFFVGDVACVVLALS